MRGNKLDVILGGSGIGLSEVSAYWSDRAIACYDLGLSERVLVVGSPRLVAHNAVG